MRRFRSPARVAVDRAPRRAHAARLSALAGACLLSLSLAGAPAAAQGMIEPQPELDLDLPGQDLPQQDLPGRDLGEDALAAPAPVGPQADRRLEQLFERLAGAEDEDEARGVSLLIHRRWMRSGSDTADLLMVRAQQAIRAQDHALAIELLDRVLALEPDWAEAWNRRAISFHNLGDPISAMADIHRVLVLEPRHFNAWAGLGHILRQGGDDRGALASYERAIAINPHIPRLRPIVERLRREIEGVDL